MNTDRKDFRFRVGTPSAYMSPQKGNTKNGLQQVIFLYGRNFPNIFFLGETNILRRFYEHKGNVPATIPAVDGHTDIPLGMIHNLNSGLTVNGGGLIIPAQKLNSKIHNTPLKKLT